MAKRENLPGLTPFLLRFLASARPHKVEAATAALASLMKTALADHQELARRSGLSGHMRRTGALQIVETERGYAAATAGRAISRSSIGRLMSPAITPSAIDRYQTRS